MSTGDAATAAIVDLEIPEATKRFHSLWNSTFGMIQERNRLAHELETSADTQDHAFLRTFPYFARNKSIMKHMHTLMQALDTWKKRSSASDSRVPTMEQLDAWSATVAQLLELLSETGQTMNDPHGTEMIQELRSKYPYALEARKKSEDHGSRLDMIQSMADMPTSRFSTSQGNYDEREASALFAQNEAWNDQERHLEQLNASISRQHNISLRMNEELELQTGIIGGLDTDVESTGLRLGGASTRLERFRDSVKEHGSLWTIFVCIVILILLIAWVK